MKDTGRNEIVRFAYGEILTFAWMKSVCFAAG